MFDLYLVGLLLSWSAGGNFVFLGFVGVCYPDCLTAFLRNSYLGLGSLTCVEEGHRIGFAVTT